MLFLKRCSDVFLPARDKIIQQKVAQGLLHDKAARDYGNNPDYYDDFFVPDIARWPHLIDKLNDSTEPYAGVLNKAIAALGDQNPPLEHVLDHIDFMKQVGNKRVLSDEDCRSLVRHFNKHRLRNEDFQFSDLLGAAYEFLINMFAESAGKKRRRLLHAARCHPSHGALPQAAAGHDRLRSMLRFGRHAHHQPRVH